MVLIYCTITNYTTCQVTPVFLSTLINFDFNHMLHLYQNSYAGHFSKLGPGSVVKVPKNKSGTYFSPEFSPYRPIVHSRAIISFALSIDTLIISLALSLYTLCEEIDN